MKNKSIIIKIIIVGSFLLFLLVLIVIFSFIKIIVPKNQQSNEKRIITNNYSINNIESISFDFKRADSIFESTDSDELLIIQNSKEEKFYINHILKENAIIFEEDNYFIKSQKEKYTIYIPKKFLKQIIITNGFGNININGINNEIDINNNSGSVRINDCNSNIKIKDVSGDLLLRNISGTTDVYSSTGNISINNIEGTINAETITGDIDVKDFNIIGDSYFENVSGDITIKIGDNTICNLYYYNETGKSTIDSSLCNNEVNLLNVKNITGMINIY